MTLTYRYPLIAREGWTWIAVAVVSALIVYLLYGPVSAPLWLLVLVLLFLFRDPARKVPAVPLGILSPVDGKVVAIDTVDDAYLDRQALRIRIRMGITSVYSAHSPLEGKVLQQWLGSPGRAAADAKDAAGTADGKSIRYAQWIQSDEQDDVVMVIETSPRSPRPRCYAQSGERIGQGQRCGFIRFGSQVDVLIPLESRVAVAVGDAVLAGSDIIATLVHARHTAQTPMQTATM
ncbi:MAG: phosphatidylserine decarboxylase [Gammaproteobacteria bacterium]|nr:phosphatidylserine decarboxylase [Gammaproteobacteria bacterium]